MDLDAATKSDGPTTIVELTWWVTATRWPRTAEPVLSVLQERLPSAIPLRFGPGDPPSTRVGTDLTAFEAYWSGRANDEWGADVAWVGSKGVYNVSMRFPDRRTSVDSPGPAVGRLQVSLNAERVRSDPDACVGLFVDLAAGLKSFYACAYVLRGWSVRRNILSMHVQDSETSPLPGGSFWIGLPPGAPWLTWFGPAYAALLDELIGERGQKTHDGVFLRSNHDPEPMDVAAATLPSLPDDLLAQRPDPRFRAVTPSVPARIIPKLGEDPSQTAGDKLLSRQAPTDGT